MCFVMVSALLLLLAFLDGYFVNHAYHNTLIKGPSVQLVFGFEVRLKLICTTSFSTGMSFFKGLHTIFQGIDELACFSIICIACI